MLQIASILNGRYRILKPLGQGGYGAVYLAKDERLGNEVAIKETNDLDGNQVLKDEAALMASLDHPNLAKVFDCFDDAGSTYVVMAYIQGRDLWFDTENAMQQRKPLPEANVVSWAVQACRALKYLHEHDIVHRDVKPHNLRLKPDDTVVLIDLGIAKRGSGTRTGRLKRAATDGFAPPEQYKGGTTYSADVYGLGATMYTMLTATIPPNGLERLGEAGGAMIPLKPPRSLNPIVTIAIENIILKAMHLSSTHRYVNGGEMLDALTQISLTVVDSMVTYRVANPLTMMVYTPLFCRFCGRRLSRQANFCTRCGKSSRRQLDS